MAGFLVTHPNEDALALDVDIGDGELACERHVCSCRFPEMQYFECDVSSRQCRGCRRCAGENKVSVCNGGVAFGGVQCFGSVQFLAALLGPK